MDRVVRLALAAALGLLVFLALISINYSSKPSAKKPAGYVILEFDDGYAEIYDAFKIMQKHGYTHASLMMPTAFISPSTTHRQYFYDMCGDDPWACDYFETLSYAEIRRMVDGGWDVQAHGVSHVPLSTLNLKDSTDYRSFMREILTPKRVLKEWFGQEPVAFTPPHLGLTDEQWKIVCQHYEFVVRRVAEEEDALNYVFDDPSQRQNLRAFHVFHQGFDKQMEALDRILTKLETEKAVVIILIHRVSDQDARGWDITTQELKELLSLLEKHGFTDENVINYSILHQLVHSEEWSI